MASIIRKNSPTVARIFGNKQTQLKTDAEANLFVTVSQSNGGSITSFQDPNGNNVQSTSAQDGAALVGAENIALVGGYNAQNNRWNTIQITTEGSLKATQVVNPTQLLTVSASHADFQNAVNQAIALLPLSPFGLTIIDIQSALNVATYDVVIIYTLDV